MRQLKRFISFFGISGLGWCVDFCIFWLLTHFLNMSVVAANYLSTAPAITLVFFMATRHTFQEHKGRVPLWQKYVIYAVYQVLLVTAVSWLGQALYDLLAPLETLAVILPYLKLIIKICITPVTMLINYLVLGRLIERL